VSDVVAASPWDGVDVAGFRPGARMLVSPPVFTRCSGTTGTFPLLWLRVARSESNMEKRSSPTAVLSVHVTKCKLGEEQFCNFIVSYGSLSWACVLLTVIQTGLPRRTASSHSWRLIGCQMKQLARTLVAVVCTSLTLTFMAPCSRCTEIGVSAMIYQLHARLTLPALFEANTFIQWTASHPNFACLPSIPGTSLAKVAPTWRPGCNWHHRQLIGRTS